MINLNNSIVIYFKNFTFLTFIPIQEKICKYFVQINIKWYLRYKITIFKKFVLTTNISNVSMHYKFDSVLRR